jgi:predicted ATP-grasp superfamily ATP-dependent carboligase
VRLRALVTDAEQRSTLAACRALHDAGYLVSTVATERPALTHWSRCNDVRLHAPNPRETVSGFARRLAEIVAAQEYALVLPGSDASLIAISEHRAALEPHVSSGLPTPQVVERALDKLALLEAAAQAGLAPPPSVVCSDADEVRPRAPELGYPLILKPARSFLRVGDTLRQRTAEVVRTEDELARKAPEFGTPFVLQRYAPEAPILSCTGVIGAGGLVALAVARYWRTWPAEAGPSSFSETIEPPSGLPERIETLLRILEWRGIFQLQLLELDGGPATLDFNGRIFGSLELAVAAGANLPAIWADIVRGHDVTRVIARPGVCYRWEEGDAHHFIRQLRRRRLRAAAAVLAPHRRVAHAYFRLRDPAPLAAAVGAAVGRRRRRRTN